MPPYHWWRTVFFLIPAIALYTIVLGTLSIGSSLFEKRGYFAHWVRANLVPSDFAHDRSARGHRRA